MSEAEKSTLYLKLGGSLITDKRHPERARLDVIERLAAEIAEAAPLAVESTRETLRGDLADAVARQVEREFAEQQRLSATADHEEGKRAVAERRPGLFNRA